MTEHTTEPQRPTGWPVHLRVIALKAQLNDLWGAGRLISDPLAVDPADQVDVDTQVREAFAHLLHAETALIGVYDAGEDQR